MISILNRTDRPFDLVELKTEEMVILKKVLLTTNTSNKNKCVHTEKSVDIKLASSLLSKDKKYVASKLSKMVNMNCLEVISDNITSVIFNKKDFSPSIICTTNVSKAFGIISLNMKNKVIGRMDRTGCFLLDLAKNKDELTMFISVNNKDNPFKISIIDKNTKKVNSMVFYNDNGKLRLEEHTEKYQISEAELSSYTSYKKTIPLFRPAKPTTFILTFNTKNDKPKKELSKVIDVTNHVITHCQNTSHQVLSKFISQCILSKKVSAITIYTDGMTDTQINEAVKYCSKIMKIVYTMDRNGKIKKHKIS